MNEEYRVKVSVRNNLILMAIEDHGYTNIAKFAKANNISLVGLYAIINLKDAPLLVSGEFSPLAMKLMEILGACPTDLWTEEQLRMRLRNNYSERVLSKEAMLEALAMNSRAAIELAEDRVYKQELEKLVEEGLNCLTPREAKILTLRYGLRGQDPHSLEEIGDKYDVTTQAIRRVEIRALQKMKKLDVLAEREHD